MTKQNQAKQVYIIIPAYQEAKRIGDVIASIPREIVVKGQDFAVHVVVIDDCSKDKTGEVAKKAGAKVIKHIINCGAGGATRTGLHYVLGLEDADYAITIDADGQHDVGDIARLLEKSIEDDVEMVVGNRLHSGNLKNMPWYRNLGNWGLRAISWMLFSIKVKDTQSGLKLIRFDALIHVSEYTIDRYGFCTEMLWLATKAKINIKEVPIKVKYSKETLAKGQNNWGAVSLILDLIWIRVSR